MAVALHRAYRALALAFVVALGVVAPAGAQVHVADTGAGERCAILLHPFGASGDVYAARAQKLAAKGLRVVAPDLPGHGKSDALTPWRYDTAAQRVRDALPAACAKPAFVFGASSGGIVALKLAAMLRDAAPVVVVVGVASRFDAKGAASLAANDDARFKDLAQYGESRYLDPDELARIAGPVLVAHGEADAFFGVDAARELASELPRGTLVLFPRAQHLEPMLGDRGALLWSMIDGLLAAP